MPSFQTNDLRLSSHTAWDVAGTPFVSFLVPIVYVLWLLKEFTYDVLPVNYI